MLRELSNNSDWNYMPVVFIDDDPMKKDKVIHGLKVFDGNGRLADICREKEIAEILISTRGMSAEHLRKIREICRENNVILKRAQIKIEPIDFI